MTISQAVLSVAMILLSPSFLEVCLYGNSRGGFLQFTQALSVEHVEQSLDPTIELHRLMKEGKFDEAFNKAFASMDLQLVSWLCLQVIFWPTTCSSEHPDNVAEHQVWLSELNMPIELN